jgi:hypothetical protein
VAVIISIVVNTDSDTRYAVGNPQGLRPSDLVNLKTSVTHEGIDHPVAKALRAILSLCCVRPQRNTLSRTGES